MPPRSRAPCQICNQTESRYTCSKCMVLYCSVGCYRSHKEQTCSEGKTPSAVTPTGFHFEERVENEDAGVLKVVNEDDAESAVTPGISSSQLEQATQDDILESSESRPLRPLTSLRWPYVPEESAYPDPLKRDDPKPLQLPQYEAIATSADVRKALAAHPSMPALLRSLNSLRGTEREDALQHALGVSFADDLGQAGSSMRNTLGGGGIVQTDEERGALRTLAEAVEAAVRGGKAEALGLDWEGTA